MGSRSSTKHGVAKLYGSPVPSRRSGPFYNAFSYPTKIDPEAIALFIACHTSPGDTVLDVFAGSGTTGLAAILCESPTESMKAHASRLDLPVEWGPRSVVLYELSVIGALLSDTMTNPPDPSAFEEAARNVVARVSKELAWLYSAEDPHGDQGHVRHIVWTEVLICPACSREATFWDLAVHTDPPSIHKHGSCNGCGQSLKFDRTRRAVESVRDPVLDRLAVRRIRRPAFLYGSTGSRTWGRSIRASDLRILERVAQLPVPPGVPTGRIIKGDLYRTGYHHGIDRFHHFYTRRNLIVLGTLWRAIDKEPPELRQALRLLLLSYNASHSTLMTRIAAKRRIPTFVVTGAQSGVLYISSLPVEKNILNGVSRKIKVFRRAFSTSFGCQSQVRVVNASSTKLELPDSTVDYVFTDPPFGDYIPYAEVNQINEAWLGSLTDRSDEVIISRNQNKSSSEYGQLMKQVFAEVGRVLKPGAPLTVVFHSSRSDVWRTLGDAFDSNDFHIVRSSLLDKRQVSFKQVVTNGYSGGNAVFWLQHGTDKIHRSVNNSTDSSIAYFARHVAETDNLQHLYTSYAAFCMEKGQTVTVGFNEFSARMAAISEPLERTEPWCP